MGGIKRAKAHYREDFYGDLGDQTGHRIHFSFWKYGRVWYYRFIGDDIATLGPMRKTADPRKLRDMAEKGGGCP